MSVYDFTVKDQNGADRPLSEWKGKVLLIVNTATKCGFTPQYAGLQALYERYHDRGLEILDFPCNQFGGQAPGSAEEINAFCEVRYGTRFPRFEKIKVNGREAAPLYEYLKKEKPGVAGGAIKWNFTKFLIDREGRVAARYAPADKPEDLAPALEALL